MPTEFTPIAALVGGLLIGVALRNAPEIMPLTPAMRPSVWNSTRMAAPISRPPTCLLYTSDAADE